MTVKRAGRAFPRRRISTDHHLMAIIDRSLGQQRSIS